MHLDRSRSRARHRVGRPCGIDVCRVRKEKSEVRVRGQATRQAPGPNAAASPASTRLFITLIRRIQRIRGGIQQDRHEKLRYGTSDVG